MNILNKYPTTLPKLPHWLIGTRVVSAHLTERILRKKVKKIIKLDMSISDISFILG
jgi:hypothetical protein